MRTGGDRPYKHGVGSDFPLKRVKGKKPGDGCSGAGWGTGGLGQGGGRGGSKMVEFWLYVGGSDDGLWWEGTAGIAGLLGEIQEFTLRHVRGSVVDCWIDGPEYRGRHPIGHGKGLRVISLCLVFKSWYRMRSFWREHRKKSKEV